MWRENGCCAKDTCTVKYSIIQWVINIVYFSDKTGETNTFILVYFNGRPQNEGIIEASFFFDTRDDRMKERHCIEVDFSSGEAVVIWKTDNS